MLSVITLIFCLQDNDLLQCDEVNVISVDSDGDVGSESNDGAGIAADQHQGPASNEDVDNTFADGADQQQEPALHDNVDTASADHLQVSLHSIHLLSIKCKHYER